MSQFYSYATKNGLQGCASCRKMSILTATTGGHGSPRRWPRLRLMLRQARPPGVHLPWRDEYRAGVYRDLRKDRAASVHAWEAHEGVPNIPFHGALISNSNDRSVAKERTGLQGGCRTGSSRREFNSCVFGYGSIFLRNIRVSNHAGC